MLQISRGTNKVKAEESVNISKLFIWAYPIW